MRRLITFLFCAAASLASASEPGFVATYQPLGGMAGSDIHLARVLCISKYAYSDDHGTIPIGFIHMANHPPADNGKSPDCNLASRIGLQFRVDWTLPDQPKFVLDASNLATEAKASEAAGQKREMVIRACLECLRRCTPRKMMNVKVILVAKNADKPELEKIVENYNKHDKTSPFFGAGS